MDLQDVTMKLVTIGASYPNDSDEYKAVLIAASVVQNVNACFGLTAERPSYEVLSSARDACQEIANMFDDVPVQPPAA